MARPRLVSFDLDGTLLPRTSICLEIGKARGYRRAIQELEDRYARGEISNSDVARQDAAFYRHWAVAEAESLVLSLPFIGGLRETLDTLKQHSIHLLLVTVTWSFASHALARAYGFDASTGATLGERGGRFTGEFAGEFEAEEKPRFVQRYASRHGIALQDCAAIGDSRSDLPLFREVGLPIAFNATPEARAAARLALEGEDLRVLLPPLLDAD